jgi:HSP20 family molecular chaperone IbpA
MTVSSEDSKNSYSTGSGMSETATKYVLTVDVPGAKSGDLFVKVDQNGKVPVIHITGTHRWGEFDKSFPLTNADLENISSSLSLGVLVVTIPKKVVPGKSDIIVAIQECDPIPVR